MRDEDQHDEDPHAEGFFVSEQERVAEEAAWHDQMASEEAPGTALVPVEYDPENPDPPVNPLDIPDAYDLPMFGQIVACPKCGYETVQTEYHPLGVLDKPCGERFGWPAVQNLGEHLCRTCARCSFGWPEAVRHGAA